MGENEGQQFIATGFCGNGFTLGTLSAVMVRDRLARAEGKSLDDLKFGEGKILNLDGKKVAAYRSDDGKVFLCSPVCTHLKCIVHWNPVDKTWDCPCHGSRFKPNGEVFSGPAEEPLEKMPWPEKEK